jgi:BioD-like phosphotransacetylase family protein
MRSIFIGSTGAGPGQTLAAWALAIKLQEKGLRVGFFKPYGLLPGLSASAEGNFCDSDVLLFREILEITEPEELLCPVTLTENLIPELTGEKGEELIARIGEAFAEVGRNKDVVLIMGAREIFFGGGLSGLADSDLVRRFDARVLLADRFQRDNMTLYSLLSLNSFLDGRVKAAIVNHVPGDKMGHVREKVLPFLREKGMRSVFAVPEDPVLAAFTVSAVAVAIEGEVLCCPEQGRSLIETFTIGSKPLEGSLAIFRQVYNKILMLGLKKEADPNPPVEGIILTGGKAPAEIVLRVARERSIPLLLTRGDTFQTMEKLERAKPALGMKDEFKVRRFLELIEAEPGGKEWADPLL